VRVGLRSKILAGFAVMLILAIVLGVLGLNKLDSVASLLGTQYDGRLVPIRDLGQARADLDNLTIGNAIQFATAGHASLLRPGYTATVQDQSQDIETLISGYAAIAAGSADEAAGIARFQSDWSAYQVAYQQLLTLLAAGHLDAALSQYSAQDLPLKMKAETDLTRLIAMNNTKATALDTQGDQTYSDSRTLIIAMLLAALLIGSAIALTLANSVVGAARQVARAAQGLARGEIQQQVNVRSRDELGQMAAAMRQMITYQRAMADVADSIAAGNLALEIQPQSEQDVLGTALRRMSANLRSLVAELQQGAQNLASASAEILAATTQQSSGATEQAAAITQTTATIDEVKASADQATQVATRVTESAEQVTRVAGDGVTAVHNATSGMADIRARVQAIAENILALSEQSQQIGEIISTVSDLADQSNLLALNAAIEASRAGEHGKGFTVVAQEIRTLAEQSKAATTQVRTILSDIQRATNTAVLATEQGTKGADAGVGLVERAGQAIDVLATASEQTVLSVAQIAAAVRQHAIGMEQIAQAMLNINQATNQNLAATGNTQQAARNLSDLAQRFAQLVTLYRI
jgi:methyl-accepting chemotaxis protein